ncbi:MAG: hypothetical protein II861_03915 [Methanomicrobium sp.]|nr:hypothetical protein [Methanomicrobium sp.]
MMRDSDEIMAEYLLKGAKMLGKTCPECGSPLFTVNGETYCVVCRENKAQSAKAATAAASANAVNAADNAKDTKAGRNRKKTVPAGKSSVTESESDMTARKLGENAEDEECTDSCGECGCGCEELRSGIEAAMTILCRRIKSDTRPEDCVALMQAVSIGADILKKLE